MIGSPEISPISNPEFQAATRGRIGSLFTSERWWEAMGSEYGFAPVVSSLDGFGSALAWHRVVDARGPRVRSLPFSDMTCGPMVDPDWTVLLDSLGEAEDPALVWTLYDGSAPAGWAKDQPAVWQGIDLTGGRDEMLAGCRPTYRSNIRRYDREGFVTRFESSAAALDDFYDLHLSTRRHRHGLLPQGRSLFHHQFDTFGDDLGVVRVEKDGSIEAAAVVIVHDGVLYYKYSASSPEYRRLGINARLVFGLIEHGLERGVRMVDLGRSDLGHPGLMEFKAGFRPRLLPLYRYRREGRVDRAASELGATLGRLTDLYVDPSVPDRITEAAGAELYRYFA